MGSAHLRATALFTAAAIGVHQLRYLIGHGGASGEALAHEGHAYLSAVLPGAGALLLAALAQLVLAARAGTGCGASHPRSLLRAWIGAAGALLAIYVGQELVEGMLFAGHPGGLEAVAGHFGWLALPLSLGLGLCVALLLRGAAAILAASARAHPPRRQRTARKRPFSVDRPADGVMARHLAGRAPPPAPG